MADVVDRALVAQKVGRLEAALGGICEQLAHINWLAVEPDARRSVPDLCRQTRADFQRVAGHVERFCLAYQPGGRRTREDARLLGIACSQLLDMQVVALDVHLGALSLLPSVEGDDLEYLRGVIQAAESVFSSHTALVQSALGTTGPDLVQLDELCWTSPGAVAAHQVFLRLSSTEFPEFKVRVLAQVPG
jgi:hypothetical protein